MTTIITKTITKICVPLVIMFSIAIYLQGHQKPGGGFIGGVMFASIIALLYVAFNLEYVKSFFNPDWSNWFAFGLFLAVMTAFAPMLVNHNFFRSAITFLHVPFLGEIELVSAALFDTGVYFVVIGGLLFIFKNVGDDK